MLPAIVDDLKSDFTISELPTRTYQLNIKQDSISGYVTELEAMKQAIYLILNIQRYQYLIYSWNYGIELEDLYGQPSYYVISILETRITEALSQDTRIKSVDDFSFETDKRKVSATFTVSTIYGKITTQKVVDI